MAFGFDISALPAYTDQLSLDLISKVVLKTDLLDYVDLRSGFTSGTVSINLVDADLPVSALSCGWTSDGEVTYTQVPVTIESLQSKTEMCVEDLRSVYQSAFMNAGTGKDLKRKSLQLTVQHFKLVLQLHGLQLQLTNKL